MEEPRICRPSPTISFDAPLRDAVRDTSQAGHAGAPLGYVIPAFRGGGVSMDYALVDGVPMMENGVIRPDYRQRFQDEDGKRK